eukprot:UN24993
MDAKIDRKEFETSLPYLKGRWLIDKNTELEEEVDCRPFQRFSIMTGTKQTSTFGKLFGTSRKQVGTVKGLWKLSKNRNDHFGEGVKSLLEPRGVVVHLYVLKADIKVAMDDEGNTNDPYLIVKLGDQEFSTRSRYMKKTMQPLFHEAFEWRIRLPGPSELKIEVWDWDGIGDDMIGGCSIDIEDRWFSKAWRKLDKTSRPVEWKPLFNPKNQKQPYGKLKFWLDMWTMNEARDNPIQDIALPPIEKWQLRIVVWNAKNCVIKDEITGQNDLFVRVIPMLPVAVSNPRKRMPRKETDLHWRAKWGKGSWNWRMIWDFELGEETFMDIDQKDILIKFSIYDMDFLSHNDLIGETSLEVKDFFLFAFKAKQRIIL